MPRPRRVLVPIAELALLMGGVLAVLVPASPLIQKFTSWDSGVFLYIGWRLNAGALLYRDLWDHKPPLIYWINALGLLLANNSRWGPWALEVIAFTAAAVIGYSLLKRAFGRWTSIYFSVAWLLNAFTTMDGGNYTTEYALPFQFAQLWLVGRGPLTVRRAAALGALGAVCFWFKQNTIGISIAITLYLLWLAWHAPNKVASVRALGALTGGAALVSALVLLPFVIQGTLRELRETAFDFNFFYIEDPWWARLWVLRLLPTFLPVGGFVLLAVFGWLGGVLIALNAWRADSAAASRWQESLTRLLGAPAETVGGAEFAAGRSALLIVALLAFPLELYFVGLSANPFDHYFLAVLAVFSVLGAFTLRLALHAIQGLIPARWGVPALACGLTLAAVFLGLQNLYASYQRLTGRTIPPNIAYLAQRTRPQDRLVVWGSEPRALFAARRVLATRYLTPAAILRANYSTVGEVEQYLVEVRNLAPPLIFDSHAPRNQFMTFPVSSKRIVKIRRWVAHNYRVKQQVGAWTVYERVKQ